MQVNTPVFSPNFPFQTLLFLIYSLKQIVSTILLQLHMEKSVLVEEGGLAAVGRMRRKYN